MRYLVAPFLCWLCLLISFDSVAQDPTIRGRIVDSSTKEPVPYATIRVKGKTVGVIANADGDFYIPVWLESVGDTIVVSCIGYTTTRYPFKSLDHQIVNELPLVPVVTELKEVVVRARKRIRREGEPTTEGIVARAIKNINVNYPQQPYSYLGYYRDYQVREGTYMNLNEAIVEVFDKGFPSNDQLSTDISLFEYKKNMDFIRDTTMDVPYDNKPNAYDKARNKYIPNAFLFSYGGNELSILRLHDAIRNFDRTSYSFVNVFSKDFLNNHYLKREEDVWLDTLALYCISFESMVTAAGRMNFAKGKIYIERRTFGIHKFEYAVYNKTMRENVLMYDIKVEYALHGSLLYLNYISFNNFFKTQNDVDFKMINFEYDPTMNAFVVSLNAPPNPADLVDLSKFSIKSGETPINIKHVEKIEERKIAIFLDDAARDIMRKENDKVSSNLTYKISIRDQNNRELDKHSVTPINQFRELFVEEVHPEGIIRSSIPVVRKDIPLANNPTQAKKTGEYWMNPPLLKR
jgi:hypothetical protein